MKLLLAYGEHTVPPNHGGRVDVYRRLLALQDLGVEVVFVGWYNEFIGETRQSVAAGLSTLVSKSYLFPLIPMSKRPWLLASYPAVVSLRSLPPAAARQLAADLAVDRPDAILIDGILAAPLIPVATRALGKPYFYRSHNIEHHYMRAELRLAATPKARLRSFLNWYGMQRYEESVLRNARHFFDNAVDDFNALQARGFSNGTWVSPVLNDAHARALGDVTGWNPSYDVGYLGNLYNPNNLQGLTWFMTEVVPRLRQAQPQIRMMIAGSRPIPAIRELAAKAGVTLIDSPPQSVPLLRDARVLVNPVFAGSGINIKSIEMLHTPARLVSTRAGVASVPEKALAHFTVTDDPEAFAKAILAGIDAARAGPDQSPGRIEATKIFSSERIADLVRRIGEG